MTEEQPLDEVLDEVVDEFPKLTELLAWLVDTKDWFNTAAYGDMPGHWVEQLDKLQEMAKEAKREVMAHPGEYDDMIVPIWLGGVTVVLTHQISGDAYLDMAVMDGEEVPIEAYKEPPSDPSN